MEAGKLSLEVSPSRRMRGAWGEGSDTKPFPFPFPDSSSEKPRDVSETPRQTVPLPLLSTPPCLDISSAHQAGFQSKRNCLQERGKLTSF